MRYYLIVHELCCRFYCLCGCIVGVDFVVVCLVWVWFCGVDYGFVFGFGVLLIVLVYLRLCIVLFTCFVKAI